MEDVLRATNFDETRIQECAIGAGVVPVARRYDGKLVFLLAREQHTPNWRGSCKWSGFEGGRKAFETIEETACREWREESIDIIPGLEQKLRSRGYVCRYTLNIVPNRACRIASERSNERYHVTYLVQIPYSEDVVCRFNTRRAALRNVVDRATALQSVQRALGGSSPLRSAERHDDEHGTLTFESGTVVDGAATTRWFDHQRQLSNAIEQVGCDIAVRQTQCASTGEIMDATVNRDFLEKESIAWWSLPELRDVLRNGGRSGEESFRTYFLPVLCGILAHVESLETKSGSSEPALR